MLFHSAHFEQHFSEGTLRKAMTLFGRGRTELLEKRSPGIVIMVVGNREVQIKRKGDKIISFACSCRRTSFCEHFAAALLKLHEEQFRMQPEGKLNALIRTREQKIPVKNIQGPVLWKSLLNTSIDKKTASLLHLITGDNAGESYYGLIESLLKPYFKKDRLSEKEQNDIEIVLGKLETFLKRRCGKKFNSAFYFHLSSLAVLINFEPLQLNHGTLQQWIEKRQSLLASFFENGLSSPEKTAWEKACLLSLKNNGVFRNRAWLFLIPRVLTWIRNRSLFTEIRLLLSKRRNDRRFYEKIDWFEVVRQQFEITERRVFRLKVRSVEPSAEFENFIACAELCFNNGNVAKGTKLLNKAYLFMVKERRECFDEFTIYALEKAETYNLPELKLFILEERLIKTIFISENELSQWLKNLPAKTTRGAVDRLLKKLREPNYYSFEKIATLLQFTNRIPDLLEEIGRQEYAFTLLHELALKQGPSDDPAFLMLYARQLALALGRIRLYSGQTALYIKAEDYLLQLTDKARKIVIDKLSLMLGSASNMAKFIIDRENKQGLIPQA